MSIYSKNINNIFFIFLISHLIIWTVIPSITNNNLPLDTIEALAWGSNLDWGFNKHPPVSAFFSELFFNIFGSHDWAYYLLSQLFVIISFFSLNESSFFLYPGRFLRIFSSISFPLFKEIWRVSCNNFAFLVSK